MFAVFRKELADHLTSVRFLILLFMIFGLGILVAHSAAHAMRADLGYEAGKFVFLRLFTSSGERMLPFVTLFSLLIPLIGIVLGFDAVNRERSGGTLSLTLSQPIYRDAFITGKFLACVVVMMILVAGTMLVVSGIGLRMIGVPPTSEEALRLLGFFLFSIVYAAFWIGLAILFSVLLQRTATSIWILIGIWIFFAFIMPFIAKGEAIERELPSSTEGEAIMRISPITLYQEGMEAILIPSMRSLSPVLPAEAVNMRMLPTTLPASQSLLLVWPHLVGLITATIVCFAVSYIKFTREEIRAP